MKEKFIVIWAEAHKNSCPTSSAVLFETFDEALEYARNQASYHKHLCSKYEELVGTNKRHACIRMSGKYINASYTISNLGYDNQKKVLDTHLNTYCSWDYLPDGIAI